MSEWQAFALMAPLAVAMAITCIAAINEGDDDEGDDE